MKRRIKHKKWWLLGGVVCVLLLCVAGLVYADRQRSDGAVVVSHAAANAIQTPNEQPQDEPAQSVASTPPATPPSASPPVAGSTTPPPKQQWPVQLTLEQAPALTVVVNKKHKLPDAYVPGSLVASGSVLLRAEAANALAALISTASASGHSLYVLSGYRSFATQKQVYNNYVAQDGQAAADTYSARPGYSEHQTGLAADVGNGTCNLETCFGDTAAGKWVAANAQLYGFIVRYPQGKEAETGYQYEPWHLRYVGVDTAKAVYASGKTLDQYYNVPAGGYE